MITLFGATHPVVLAGLALLIAGGSSVVLTYVVRQRARHARLFDRTDARKLHRSEIPRIGGVAIVLSVALTLVALAALGGPGIFTSSGNGLLVVLGGGLAIHLLGLDDDLWQVPARWKFIIQIVIALTVYALGVRVTTLSLPFVGVVQLGAVVGLLFTVLWLVGITNAFNLIDGLDGLASGAALFALTTMFVVASANGRPSAALVILILAGATAGFLVYNFHPATIFLGDSGSLFLGFMLAGVGLLSAQKSSTVVAVAIPVVSLGLPVLDTSLAVFRRFLRRQPIFAADRGHIHHRLLGYGLSPRTVVLSLYAACAVLGLCAMLLVNEGGHVVVVLTLVGVGVLIAVQRLRIFEFEEAARIVRVGARQTIARNVRVHEACARVAVLHDMSEVFEVLGQTFKDDGSPRVEIRLRTTFLGEDGPDPGRRTDDDVVVWAWSRESHPRAAWWHVSIPLIDTVGERIGSMVLWQESSDIADTAALPHFHTIAGELRALIEQKLLTLWHLAPPHSQAYIESRESIRERMHAERVHAARLNGNGTGERERIHSGRGPRVA
jgi:UDP-GlcNAc:undecaprenyl-phosphate/decaprenyl-phosphate GlcNAc-1-phosphate transferase